MKHVKENRDRLELLEDIFHRVPITLMDAVETARYALAEWSWPHASRCRAQVEIEDYLLQGARSSPDKGALCAALAYDAWMALGHTQTKSMNDIRCEWTLRQLFAMALLRFEAVSGRKARDLVDIYTDSPLRRERVRAAIRGLTSKWKRLHLDIHRVMDKSVYELTRVLGVHVSMKYVPPQAELGWHSEKKGRPRPPRPISLADAIPMD